LVGDGPVTLGLIYRSKPTPFFPDDGWKTDKKHDCGCPRVFNTVWGAASHILKELAKPTYRPFALIRLPDFLK